ncbi:glycosyltransferase [Frateuria sp. YIM B11624]|uniref:glycosyltransferase n=1 Tax=Frateuria sp. YIM B11624 TaxID=3143185 RepID=UPI003C77F573
MNVQCNLTAVVVTFNRRPLLELCLLALANQTRKPDRVLIVDNASTDETRDWLQSWLPHHLPEGEVLALEVNSGGAGGFAAGMKAAVAGGADWIWMMDDDAEPETKALSILLDAVVTDEAIYGSIATHNGIELCWPLFGTDGEEVAGVRDTSRVTSVVALPFLGILVSRRVIETIGYPNADYFLAGDDTEYCFRARGCGIPVMAVGGSVLRHPTSHYYRFGVGRFAPVCFRMPPWKRYYDVRNRLLTSAGEGLGPMVLKTLPATMLRLLATLLHEPQRLQQTKAYLAGVIDGLRGMKGKRHPRWRLDA